jgi:hypothetical protein
MKKVAECKCSRQIERGKIENCGRTFKMLSLNNEINKGSIYIYCSNTRERKKTNY